MTYTIYKQLSQIIRLSPMFVSLAKNQCVLTQYTIAGFISGLFCFCFVFSYGGMGVAFTQRGEGGQLYTIGNNYNIPLEYQLLDTFEQEGSPDLKITILLQHYYQVGLILSPNITRIHFFCSFFQQLQTCQNLSHNACYYGICG